MRKRWLLAAGTVVGLVGVVLVVAVMLPPGPSVTKANFDRLEIGMSREEAAAILGRDCDEMIQVDQSHMLAWYNQDENGEMEAQVLIRLDNGRVFNKWWRGPEGLLDRIRRWLHV